MEHQDRQRKTAGLSTLKSCLGRPISKNLVSHGLSVRRFADTSEQISAKVFSIIEIFVRRLEEGKEMKS
jgi:hypothetical protein